MDFTVQSFQKHNKVFSELSDFFVHPPVWPNEFLCN